MRYSQLGLALLLAAMAIMVHAISGMPAAAVILTTVLLDSVTSLGFQHSVAAFPGHAKPGPAKPSRLLPRRTNQMGWCYHDSNFTRPDNDTSAWIPWDALATQYDGPSELGLFYTLTALCQKMSATIMTLDIPYTHCEPDGYTNGTYAVIAQMTYLGPKDIFDMRNIYDYCLAALSLTKECEYGGEFDHVNFWYGSPNNSQYWNVKARPIVGPCPDCTGGLLAG